MRSSAVDQSPPPTAILASPRTAPSVAPILLILAVATLPFLYASALWYLGPSNALIAVVIACIFLCSFLVLELGIGLTLLAMLLSPEISLGSGLAAVRMRFSDLLLPLLLFAWLGRNALGLDRRRLISDPIQVWSIAFLSVQVLASLRGWALGWINPTAAALVIAKNLQFFIIFYFVSQYVHTQLRAIQLLRVAVATALMTALFNLPQISQTEIWTTRRISAPFESTPEPSTVGGYFVMVMAILAAMAFEAKDRPTRNFLWLLVAIIFAPFMFTLSRTSYLAFLFMVVVLSLLRRSSLTFIVILAALALSPWLLPSAVIDRITYTFNDRIKILGIFDRSLGERIYIWYKVYWSMRDTPLLGKGVTFHNVIDSYYARVLIETGLLGLACFAMIVRRLIAIAASVRRRASTWWVRGLALGFTAALISLLVHSLSAITFSILRIMEPFWAICGILTGLHSILPENSVGDAKVAAISPPQPLGEQNT